MTRLSALLLALGLLGCELGLTNEEIVKQINFCNEHGLDAVVYENFDNEVRKVECRPTKAVPRPPTATLCLYALDGQIIEVACTPKGVR